MSSPSCFGESEMKSKFVQVTSWASSEHHPDLTRGRWVMLGSPNIVTYILTGLWGPKAFLVNRFPFIRFEWSYVPFKNHCTASISRDRIVLPSGFGPDGFIKALFGQRVLK